MKTVCVGADATHGVEGDWTSNDFVVNVAVNVGPRAGDFDSFLERDVRDFGGHAANLCSGNAAALSDVFWRVFALAVTLSDQLLHAAHVLTVDVSVVKKRRRDAFFHALQ